MPQICRRPNNVGRLVHDPGSKQGGRNHRHGRGSEDARRRFAQHLAGCGNRVAASCSQTDVLVILVQYVNKADRYKDVRTKASKTDHQSLVRRYYALMSSHALFVDAVRAADSLPATLREHADDVTGLEETRFDESYIEFLDEQIRLSPRGQEWTEILKWRRAALLPFCGITLLRGLVRVADADFIVRVHPQTSVVIHWEEYEFNHDAA